jgi:hypothetical protein
MTLTPGIKSQRLFINPTAFPLKNLPSFEFIFLLQMEKNHRFLFNKHFI